MNRSLASEHYQDLLAEHGPREERKGVRPLGFARPKAVTVGYIHPRGIETQEWEAMGDEE